MPDETLSWPQWSIVDDRGLARFVTPQASRWLPLPISRFDLGGTADRLRIITRAIYDALKELNIRYSLEEYHPSEILQTIRTPREVLVSPREGTCLDLAALFCGLCEAYELLPIIILTEGHALTAVSLTHDLRDWNSQRPEKNVFADGPLTNARSLRALFDNGSFLSIECTGFAHSEKLGMPIKGRPETERRTGGTLSFEDAVTVGRRQLELEQRPLQFALDIAIAHYSWRIEPYRLEQLPGACVTNIFRLLGEAPRLLMPHLRILNFERLVAERTRNFVGRDFIFRALDDLIENAEFPSGYILIKGEPGIGKTALISQLIKTRGYVHHFNIAPENIRSAQSFLGNVCAQLIVRYGLDHTTLPIEATQDSAFLSKLLAEAAAKSKDDPVVVLVDALDEAEDVGLAVTANRLYLPRTLPEGVYFILTSREQIDYRLDVDRRKDLYLRDTDPNNLEDVRVYIRKSVELHSEMKGRIAAWNVSDDEFVELITERSEGNFMYVVHVFEDIRAGTLSVDSIDRIQNLPKGLREYYQRHWRTMRAHDIQRFEAIYEPVLRVLATVREPVSLDAVEEWTSVSPARIRDVLREWRPFLNELTSSSGETLYRVYHASFQDFLAEEGMGLKPWHKRIADVALQKIPGFLPNT